MQKSKRASQTITFQPTEEAAELLKIALGDKPDRGERTDLINKALVRQLPEMMEEIVAERNRVENALRAARKVANSKKTVEEIERAVIDAGLKKVQNPLRSSSK